jgi:hypothetical protein
MRLFVNKYANGQTFAVETSNDGSAIRKNISGERSIGERISAYVEVLCDDNVDGAERLLAALSIVKSEVEKRKEAYRLKAKPKKHRSPVVQPKRRVG